MTHEPLSWATASLYARSRCWCESPADMANRRPGAAAEHDLQPEHGLQHQLDQAVSPELVRQHRKGKSMQVLVNTDNNIEGSADLSSHVEALIQDTFGRLGDRLTRVEVYLADENSAQKGGELDKRCTMEARLGGLHPIVVTHEGSTLDQALYGAADKLEETIKRHLGKLDDHKGRTSFAGDQTL